MPFDPTIPQELTQADAAQMRAQFNGLKTLIDAVQSINGAQVVTVLTLPPGSPATATVVYVGGVLQFTLGIPEGPAGAAGPQGQPGEITVSDLNAAMASVLAQTSNNTNSVALLGMVADPSYQQWQLQDLANKVDEMISAQRRGCGQASFIT